MMKFLLLPLALVWSAQASAKTVIHWSVAHDPGNTRVLEAIRHFGSEIHKLSGGELELVLDEFTKGETNLFHAAADKVKRGEVQMSQIGTFTLAKFSPKLNVIDLPFLFRNHSHAAHVLDGPVGNELRDSLYTDSGKKLRAFAFTYSGGYRQVYGTREIHRIEDFRGLKLYPPGEKMGRDLFEQLGSRFVGEKAVSAKPEIVAAFKAGTIEGEEGEYNRLGTIQRLFGETGKIPVVNETNHSLFLTMIVINEDFYKSLSPKFQKIIADAAGQMALAEREISIQQEAGNKEMLEKSHVKIIRMSEAERARFVDATKELYEKNRAQFGELVEKIRATK